MITTDGAPAWRTYFEQHPDAGIYLKGYRDGSEATRIKLLADALKWFVDWCECATRARGEVCMMATAAGCGTSRQGLWYRCLVDREIGKLRRAKQV